MLALRTQMFINYRNLAFCKKKNNNNNNKNRSKPRAINYIKN